MVLKSHKKCLSEFFVCAFYENAHPYLCCIFPSYNRTSSCVLYHLWCCACIHNYLGAVPVLVHVQNKYSVLGYLDIYLPVCLRMTFCTKFIYCIPGVSQCLSPRPNWDPPTPSPASECARGAPPPPPQPKGWAHLPAGEGVPNSSDSL